jgi:hypothetical protein
MDIQIISSHYFWYILLTIIGVVVGVISYRQSFPPLRRFQRIILSILRSAMIVLLGVFLIEPLLNIYTTKVVTPQLAVIVDLSRSMSVEDGGVTRIERVNALLNSQLPVIGHRYKVFGFSTSLSEASGIPSASDISGDATSIANALTEFGKRSDIDNFGALLIATDGRQNLGEDPVEIASRLNMPVFTLTVGESVDEKNLAIDDIYCPAIAYSGADFKVEAELSASGLGTGKSRLTLKMGSTGVADRIFELPEQGRNVKVSFDVRAPEPGNYEYQLTTPIFEGEAKEVDNERLFAVRVLKNKLKILLISSGLDWELKFTKQMLSIFEEFDVDAVFPETGGRYSNPGTPQGLDGLNKYDVIVVVNSSPAEILVAAADLKKYISEGGSLIYMAGFDAANDIRLFEGILPVKALNARIDNAEYFFEPSPTRKQHAAILMDEDPDLSARTWHAMPPFSSLLVNFEPAGDVLIEAGVSSRDSVIVRKEAGDGQSMILPVLTVGVSGRGHVAAITGFPLWRCFFGSVGNSRQARAMPEFWRNLVKWAAATDEMENFKIITDRKVYRLGEPVRLTGYLYDESNRPKNGALVTLTINAEDDPTDIKDVVLPQIDNGIYSDEARSLPPGRYEFRGSAAAYDDTLGKAAGKFTIEDFSLEMASNAPDYNLTRRLADGTNGRPFTAQDFGQFTQGLRLEAYSRENQATIRPFGVPWLLGIIIVGLCLEWSLRKRFRLP